MNADEPTRKERVILVAEDELDDFTLLQLAHARAGLQHRLQHVATGREVLDYLQGHGGFADRTRFPFPDLLLLDLKMPDMNGFEVLEWMSHSPECAQLPVIVLSGSTMDRDHHKARQLGARAYYVKALEFKDTEEMLRNISRDWLDRVPSAPQP